MAIIADRDGLAAYRAAWDVIAIRPEDWQTALDLSPTLLVVDSARAGNGGAWSYRIARTAHPDFFLLRDLRALVDWCAERAIPTVFRVRESGAAASQDWATAAGLFDLVVAVDPDGEAAFAAMPDRHGLVICYGATGSDSEAETAGLLRAIRAAA